MKNLFVIGLQRTGTTYIEHLLNSNMEDLVFRGAINDIGATFSKHEFPSVKEKVKNSIIKQDGFVVVVKNPYMWVESICFRDEIGRLNACNVGNHTEKYNLKESTNIKVGGNDYNIFNILKLYLDYYQEWLKHKDVLFIKYESFLDESEALRECNNIVKYVGDGQVKSNFKLLSKPVRNSMDFTREMFNY